MTKILIFAIAGLAWLSCNNTESQPVIQRTSIISGAIKPPLQTWYKIAQPTSISPGQEAFVGYNEANHSLDFYRLHGTEVEFEKLIKLQFEGPNGVDAIRAIYYVNPDSIFLVSRNNILIINAQNEEIYRVNTATQPGNEIDGIDLSRYHPHVKQEAGINMAFRGDQIYLPLNYYGGEGIDNLSDFGPEIALLSSFSIGEEKFEILPIRYPEFLQENLYGLASTTLFAYSRGKVVYYFTGFPDLYIFDTETQQTKHFPCINNLPQTPLFVNMDIRDHLKRIVFYSDGVVSFDGEQFAQIIYAPSIDNLGSDAFLRITNLETGQSTIIDAPFRAVGNGMLFFQDGLLMPRMSTSEDSISFVRLVW